LDGCAFRLISLASAYFRFVAGIFFAGAGNVRASRQQRPTDLEGPYRLISAYTALYRLFVGKFFLGDRAKNAKKAKHSPISETLRAGRNSVAWLWAAAARWGTAPYQNWPLVRICSHLLAFARISAESFFIFTFGEKIGMAAGRMRGNPKSLPERGRERILPSLNLL
jgi:hypothetical protein